MASVFRNDSFSVFSLRPRPFVWVVVHERKEDDKALEDQQTQSLSRHYHLGTQAS